MQAFVETLRQNLAGDSALFLKGDPGFEDALQRWSNLGVETPLAIVQPTSEKAVIAAVKHYAEASVPFVPASGGHSSWSTVKDGLIIDLSKYKGTIVHSDETATIKGGVLMKEMQVALSKVGRFSTVGNGNTVGVIPYFINGGISIYTPLTGYACENIVSARIITATGDVVEASEHANPDLLWGIRGAGQFFGLVIEMKIRTYPLSMISPNGTRQLGTYIFTPDKAQAVCEAMSRVVEDKTRVHAGHFMVVNAPPDFKQQVLLVAPQFFGSAEEMTELFQPLVDLGPIQHMQMASNFENHSDQLEFMCAKGEFKKFSQTGVESWIPRNFVKVVELHEQLVKTCPGSQRSGYSFEWHTPTAEKGVRKIDTSFGLKGVDYWLNLFSWYTDASQHEKVASFDKAAQVQMREGSEEETFIAYTNAHRDDPLEYRYKGADRIAKLKELKKRWDPSGCFTKEFLT